MAQALPMRAKSKGSLDPADSERPQIMEKGFASICGRSESVGKIHALTLLEVNKAVPMTYAWADATPVAGQQFE